MTGKWEPSKGSLTTYIHYRVSLKLLNYQKKRYRIGGLNEPQAPVSDIGIGNTIEGPDLAALGAIDLIDELSEDAATVLGQIANSQARSWQGVKLRSISNQLGWEQERTQIAFNEVFFALNFPLDDTITY